MAKSISAGLMVKPALTAKTAPSMIKLSRFKQDQDGAAALEFALIAAPFFALLFAILEVALIFFSSALLDRAIEDASRDIRTGQTSSLTSTADDFRNEICDTIRTVMSCENLRVDVRPIENFNAADFTVPLTDDEEIDDSDFTFVTGGSEQRIMVRAYYEWKLIGPGLVNGMSNMSENRRLITSTTAFRNEPF